MPYMDTIRAVHYNLSVPYLCPQYVSFTPSQCFVPASTNHVVRFVSRGMVSSYFSGNLFLSFLLPAFYYSSFPTQFVIFKPLSYCFEETIGFDVKASFARRPVSRLIKPSDITKEF